MGIFDLEGARGVPPMNGDLWWLWPDDKMLVMLEYVSFAVRTNGDLWWVPPDGNTQVT